MKTATLAKDQHGRKVIKITFPNNRKDIENIKSLPIRSYHNSQDCWSCPLTRDNLEQLINWDFIIDSKLELFLQEGVEEDFIIPGLNGVLRPFQKIGVQFIEQHHGCALIADEMGLGKTIQTLAWLQLHPELRPALIITPASVKYNWENEINKWMTNASPQILSGYKVFEITGDIVIINYDIVIKWKNKLLQKEFEVIVLDEAHFIKNNSAQRTQTIKIIKNKIPHRLALTGTPVENSPHELFNAISIVNPSVFPDYWGFVWRYCDPKKDQRGSWDFSGSENREELHQKLITTVMLRRLKKDVAPELPPKIRTVIPMEIDNRQLYNKAERDYISFVREYKGIDASERAQGLSKTEDLKQVAVKGKLNSIIEWIDDYLETEGKLVIGTWHVSTIDVLINIYSKIAVKLDGSVTGIARQKAIDSFQNDLHVKLFIVNLKAGGIGINLTAAHNMLITEFGYNPKQMDQLEDRIHRLTTTETVNIYYAIAKGTIEEKIIKILDKKRIIVDAITDGKVTEDIHLLTELMKEYR